MKLLELRTLRNDSTEPSRVNYRVTVPREPTVSIDSETNSLLLHGFPKKGKRSKCSSIYAFRFERRRYRVFRFLACQGATGFDTIVVVAKEDDSNEAVLEITVEPSRVNGTEIKCADYVQVIRSSLHGLFRETLSLYRSTSFRFQDMCFWNASRYRIYENQPVAMIGTFGPGIYTDLCSNFHVTDYKLLNGKSPFLFILVLTSQR